MAAWRVAEWFGNGSRVTRECHARFYERRRVKFPPPTHHRQIHHTDWQVRIRHGLPEFIPPRWIDPDQTPRRPVTAHLAA